MDESPVTISVGQPSGFDGSDMYAIRAEQTIGVTKVAAWIPVTGEMIRDAAVIRSVVDNQLDRMLHPWKYPDRRWWPMDRFDPFPRWSRFVAFIRRALPASTQGDPQP